MSTFDLGEQRAGGVASGNAPYGFAPSVATSETILKFLLLLLGTSLALDRFVPFQVGAFTPTFLVGIALGTLGYWSGVFEPALRRFFGWAVLFSFFGLISLFANNAAASLKDSAGILIWLLLVPGIASLCLENGRWRALTLGLTLGASALLAVVLWRYARGARVLDVGHLQLLGVNRNAIDMNIVWLVAPVLWSKKLDIPRIGRWVFVAAAILWVVSSQGRTGLVALLLVPLVFVILKPVGTVARATRIALVVAAGALLYAALTTISIPGLPATQRLAQYRSGDRSSADQIRLLLNEKSLALAQKHPLTGVGLGRYEGTYDPVIEKGRTVHIRQDALEFPGHNTYYEILATVGVPGFLAYLGMLLVPLIGGIRRSHDTNVRALTTGYVILLFSITFHTSYGTLLALPMAVLLAAIARATPTVADRHEGG